MGSLSDRFGRKPILLISLTVTTVCYAFIATALTLGSLIVFGAASLLAGLAEANVVTARSAISDVIAPAERNRFFGYIYLSRSSAYIVGPLVGGKLADPRLMLWFNYATLLGGIHSARYQDRGNRCCVGETNPPESRHRVSYGEAFTNLAAVVTDGHLRRLYWLNFLFYLAIFGFFRCYPMYLVD